MPFDDAHDPADRDADRDPSDSDPSDRASGPGPDSADRGCPKCGHTETDIGTISTTGGGLSKMFDIQTNQFEVVSCLNCGYSELYRDTGSAASDVVDVFLG